MAVPTSRGKRSPTSIGSRRRGRRSAGSGDSHSRRISVGSVSYTISSCEVEDLPVDLLFYAHDGEDVYNEISKIKCLGVHHVNPWVICGDVDGRITVWDFQKQCELYRLENWPKSLELQHVLRNIRANATIISPPPHCFRHNGHAFILERYPRYSGRSVRRSYRTFQFAV